MARSKSAARIALELATELQAEGIPVEIRKMARNSVELGFQDLWDMHDADSMLQSMLYGMPGNEELTRRRDIVDHFVHTGELHISVILARI